MKIKMRNRINDRMMFKIRMRFVLAAMSALIVMQAVIIFFSVYNSSEFISIPPIQFITYNYNI